MKLSDSVSSWHPYSTGFPVSFHLDMSVFVTQVVLTFSHILSPTGPPFPNTLLRSATREGGENISRDLSTTILCPLSQGGRVPLFGTQGVETLRFILLPSHYIFNLEQHAIKILSDVSVRETEESDSKLNDKILAHLVLFGCAISKMAITINFDRKLKLGTIEVDRISPDAVLPTEFMATHLFSS